MFFPMHPGGVAYGPGGFMPMPMAMPMHMSMPMPMHMPMHMPVSMPAPSHGVHGMHGSESALPRLGEFDYGSGGRHVAGGWADGSGTTGGVGEYSGWMPPHHGDGGLRH